MIRYALRCSDGHDFDSWFQSADAYEKLAASGMIVCAVCGGDQVEKAVMAPRISTGGDDAARPLSRPASKAEGIMAEVRRKIEENADYVGLSFAAEARAIHDGLVPERAIYGEAHVDDARKLIEDGVQVAPLPFRPSRKMN